MSDSAAPQTTFFRPFGRLVFIVAIFFSAFLIFLVQPLVGKRILPWFGGTPGVWAVCLAFYQTALFAGYAYAHLLIRFVKPRFQLGVHATLVGAAILAPPVLPSLDWAVPDSGSPAWRILAMMTSHVALPFIALSSTGPLVQIWFARRYPERSPYPLYAVSNLGSMLALLAYPFWFEPRLGLAETAAYWAGGFAVAMATVLLAAELARRTDALARTAVRNPVSDPRRPSTDAQGQKTPGAGEIALWLTLAGCAVVMLNGVTNRLCLDVASVPFLWILPLATYLATLILCFSSERAYRRGFHFGLVFVLLGIGVFHGLFLSETPRATESGLAESFASLPLVIAYYTALLFGVCSILHGELYRLRPSADSLTAFYLCMSGGGAIGGLFVGVAAPALFDGYTEFGLGLTLSLLLGLYTAARARGGVRSAWEHSPAALRGAISLGLLMLAHEGWQAMRPAPPEVSQERNFYGVVRVIDSDEGEASSRMLMHGSTLHGIQFRSPKARSLPTSYYGRASSLSSLMETLPRERGSRIGAVGLGTGTIAAYAKPGDSFRFYETDPAVVRVARDDGTFSFLADSPAEIEVRLGDGRLLLAEEQARSDRQDFDILVIDAFSSDAIPVHLMTREAFGVYAAALDLDGVLAVHVSNRYFDLMPLVARLGGEVGLEHLHAETKIAPRRQTKPSRWVYLARNQERLERIQLAASSVLKRLRLTRETQRFWRDDDSSLQAVPLWTDDYSDLWSVMKTPGRPDG